MDDLVLLRNLIRSTAICDRSIDTDALFRKVRFDSQPCWYPVGYQPLCFECVIARVSSAVNVKAIVLTFEFLGVRSITACAGSATSIEGFTRRYPRLLSTVVHIDTKDDSFCSLHRAMLAIFRLSTSNVNATPCPEWIDRSTRPSSSVYSDRLKRQIAVRGAPSSKSSKAGASPEPNSPRVKLSMSQFGTTSNTSPRGEARNSPRESFPRRTHTGRSDFDPPSTVR